MPFMKEGRAAKIEEYVPLINEIINNLGVDPATCYNERKKAWHLKKGKAEVELTMFSIKRDNGTADDYIEVASPVFNSVKDNGIDFFKKLLKINNTSIGVKFALDNDDKVWLLVQRELVDLDRNEIITMLERIGNFSNDMQKQLKEEFNL